MLNEVLVGLNIKENRSTPPMLSQNQRTLGFSHLIHKSGSVGSKFRKGPDIFGGENFRHGILREIRYVVQLIVHTAGRLCKCIFQFCASNR